MSFCNPLLISNSFTLSHSLPNVNKFFKFFIFFFVFPKRKIRLISKRIKVYHRMHSTSSSFLLFSKNYKLQKNCYWQFFLYTNIIRQEVNNYFIYRPPTPPYVRFRIRRFLSFHKLLDNSQGRMYILTWLLFYLRIFDSALLPFSNILFCYRRVLFLSNVPCLMLSAFCISS